MPWVRTYSHYGAWVVALAALAGSLYFSEVAGFVPCKWCWIQRIFMYPLALLLGIACYREDRSIVLYAIPLSTAGGLVSLFHYLKQKVPWVGQISVCTEGVPCTGEYINWLGFITIPFLALTAFVMITTLLWMGRKRTE
ncbi:disulfide oxidoreductase [Paludifilum halophilum]|uniref:Disulfide bond formation protein B n=1 Tax=Paludifilum halophilum TaxID=1642702 RepID=A0A235B2P1_9BACL|nr:disulfide oxidoreductase [Paludifilum halophilum]OYD06167.1 disulfide bond formation protein B [Paludifilum halophilum]